MKKIVLCLFLILFSVMPAFAEITESDYYFKKIDISILEYKKEFLTNQRNKDPSFYNLQKKYEDIIFDMNTKDVDKISQLQCNNYNGIYSTTIDNRNNKINIQNYYNKGLKLCCSEAMTIFAVDYRWLKNHYSKGLSKEYKQWLKYMSNPVSFEEGMLNTDKKTLNRHITKLEKFIYNYPDFVGIKDVKKELNKLKYAQ